MMRAGALSLILMCLSWVASDPPAALAKPTAPRVYCETYPESPTCSGQLAGCDTCHTSTAPVAWNSFGTSLLGKATGATFDAQLPDALMAVEADDPDGDGIANLDEIFVGTNPGDAESGWSHCVMPPAAGDVPVPPGYDFRHAYQRVAVLYCGRSASFDELQAFDGLGDSPVDQYAEVHALLDSCLESDYWRLDGVQRLADARIRPIESVGIESPSGIIIADYEWDYRLWAYVMTGDRDMRDVLLADYHVDVDDEGAFVKVSGVVPKPEGTLAGGQPLEPEHRAGMITTQWFFAVNTMFSPMPRTTAAQAYRSYLGQNIAYQEGIHPVAGEPADVDDRDVDAPVCRDCHSTLDPMAYAFVWYNGILGPAAGQYNPKRLSQIPNWNGNQGRLLGRPITDARDWAEVAVESDMFRRTLTSTFFEHAVERSPSPQEEVEFEHLWRSIPGDGYRAARLIHRIVDTSAFGGRQ